MDKPSRRQTALAIILGGAVGLLFESALVAWWRAMIIYFIAFTLGLVLILPLAAFIAAGIHLMRSSRWNANLSWPILVLLTVTLWPAAIALPWGYEYLRVRHVARAAVPLYERADAPQITVRFGDAENTGDRVRFVFRSDADSMEVLRFYEAELGRRGWVKGPPHFIADQTDGTPHWFKHEAKFLSLHIKFTPGAQFEVIYGL